MSKPEDNLHAMRHSLAHITAAAVKRLWPHAKFGVGPVIENGYYYDIDLGKVTVSEADFERIETEARKIIAEDQVFEHFNLPITEAIAWAKKEKQPYKLELLNDLQRAGTTVAKDLDSAELGLKAKGDSKVEEVSFYRNGDFTDLCRGPHVASTGKVGAFKLMRVAGAYWRGKDTNPQMQRLYGVAFAKEAELKQHLVMLEEAKSRDHRKIGEDLKLFFISENVGAGLPLLMPRGETIKHELMNYMRVKEQNRGYQYVSTPVLTQSKLYERSGHASYYLENMYGTKPDEEGNIFYLKPMNCPHHHMIYEKLVDSYRDLPLRLSEHAGLYRYELSGALTGLIRMRGPITQNDSHIYVTADQVEAEFTNVLQLFEEVYKETGVKDYWFRLSLPDFAKEKYAGDKERWEWAGDIIRRCLQGAQAKFVEELDEAAFYGPKVDIQIKNVHGKEDSIATVQLDIVVPERMGIKYVDSEGKDQYPLVIHKSIMGAFERFMAFLLEQTAGKLPVWLSPEHIRIITVNQEDATVACADDMLKQGQELGLRISVDNTNESVGKKIRAAEMMKVPYVVVVGQKEIETKKVTPRIRKDLVVNGDSSEYPVVNFLKTVANEVKSRTTKTSL
ncbi:MAG TPA: threonine--tRNA ligase [Patescibacteria group bacterium]|jgi:threonyl-tRNA synthetase|nr:threonine--tRNA ligase [Patescibacteria group bacterium]